MAGDRHSGPKVGASTHSPMKTRMDLAVGPGRQLRGTELRDPYFWFGSRAGVRGRGSTGSSTTHTGSSRPHDRSVLLSGRPELSGGRSLTARNCRSRWAALRLSCSAAELNLPRPAVHLIQLPLGEKSRHQVGDLDVVQVGHQAVRVATDFDLREVHLAFAGGSCVARR